MLCACVCICVCVCGGEQVCMCVFKPASTCVCVCVSVCVGGGPGVTNLSESTGVLSRETPARTDELREPCPLNQRRNHPGVKLTQQYVQVKRIKLR